MKDLYLIACVSKDGGIGLNGDLIWHIKADMQFFRQTTLNSIVVMGSKTYTSIGNRPLPKRRNIVLSRQDVEHAETFHSQEELTDFLAHTDGSKFIIGGASLYTMFIDIVEKIYLTEVDAIKPADTYFPDFDKSKFTRKVLQVGEHDHIKYEIVEYTRTDHDLSR